MLDFMAARTTRTSPSEGPLDERAPRLGAPLPATHSPLLQAALSLIPPSATAGELEGRFDAAGARLAPGLADRLLAELVELGLARPVGRHHGGRRYVATSLGLRSIEAGLHGRTSIPLEELERLRTDLLSIIAHELRTPLTAVRTSVGLLRDPAARPTADQRQSMLDSIERNADRMQRLIGDILDLARFRTGGVSLQLRTFGAAALAEGAIAVVEPLATKAGQRIELGIAGSDDHQVFGDRRRLEQALINLIANAQRFSPDEGLVSVSVERRGAMTSWVVTDRGPGISEADQARLFERFFVGHRSGPREGVGLGLPTALAIAQAHGGTIEFRSELGVGSTFAVVVPTAGPEDER